MGNILPDSAATGLGPILHLAGSKQRLQGRVFWAGSSTSKCTLGFKLGDLRPTPLFNPWDDLVGDGASHPGAGVVAKPSRWLRLANTEKRVF